METLFRVKTPLGYVVRVAPAYWQYLVQIKHPSMRGKEGNVQEILQSPDVVVKSRLDENVFLYYGLSDRLYCLVVKHLSGNEGFLITAYPVDKVKKGEIVWTK